MHTLTTTACNLSPCRGRDLRPVSSIVSRFNWSMAVALFRLLLCPLLCGREFGQGVQACTLKQSGCMASDSEPVTHIAGAANRAYQLSRSNNLRNQTINAFTF